MKTQRTRKKYMHLVNLDDLPSEARVQRIIKTGLESINPDDLNEFSKEVQSQINHYRKSAERTASLTGVFELYAGIQKSLLFTWLRKAIGERLRIKYREGTLKDGVNSYQLSNGIICTHDDRFVYGVSLCQLSEKEFKKAQKIYGGRR